MRRLILALLTVFVLVAGTLSADDTDQRQLDAQQSVLWLHTQEGPAREYIIWGECGKRLRGDKAMVRSAEYAQAIVASVDAVEQKTGEQIDLDYMVSVLYRESSHDECVIGRQETTKLTEELGHAPDKNEIIEHVKTWTTVYYDAKKQCKERGLNGDIKCIGNIVGKTHPHYRGIHGWDLGAAQYRWPGYNFRRRNVVLPSGRRGEKVGLKEIFDYEVAIQMLAEDMASHRKRCREEGHEHWLTSRWGRRLRKLDTEEAYFAHHHTGGGAWSEKYWKAVNKHLKVIRDKRAEMLVAQGQGTGGVAMAR